MTSANLDAFNHIFDDVTVVGHEAGLGGVSKKAQGSSNAGTKTGKEK